MSLIEEFCCTLIILISSAVIFFSEVCCEVDLQKWFCLYQRYINCKIANNFLLIFQMISYSRYSSMMLLMFASKVGSVEIV